MKIDRIMSYTYADLIGQLAKTPLKGSTIEIYKDSTFICEYADPRELLIAQHYIMSPILANLGDLNNQLLDRGISFMDMKGFLSFTTEEDPETWIDLTPPIVEQDPQGWLICDGAHRVSLARKLNRNIRVIKIAAIPEEYPYYAYPNENGWADVSIVDTPPETKKAYRVKEYKKLFRDFNSSFTNVTRKR